MESEARVVPWFMTVHDAGTLALEWWYSTGWKDLEEGRQYEPPPATNTRAVKWYERGWNDADRKLREAGRAGGGA